MKQEKQFDGEKKRRAALRASLRGAVSLYLLYLAAGLFRSRADSTLPPAAAVGIGAAFAAAAAAFGVYAWRQYRRDLQNAQLPPADGGDS